MPYEVVHGRIWQKGFAFENYKSTMTMTITRKQPRKYEELIWVIRIKDSRSQLNSIEILCGSQNKTDLKHQSFN